MLEKNTYKVACDSGSCKNVAEFSIRAKGFGRGGKFYLCASCLNELNEELKKMTTPKSPKNMIARGRKEESVCE